MLYKCTEDFQEGWLELWEKNIIKNHKELFQSPIQATSIQVEIEEFHSAMAHLSNFASAELLASAFSRLNVVAIQRNFSEH